LSLGQGTAQRDAIIFFAICMILSSFVFLRTICDMSNEP